jgi:DNA-binding NtrC family response regulator
VHPVKILVVDDEPVAADSVRRMLKYRGYRQVTVCYGGEAAIAQIQKTDFDIVLLDILMPHVDGLEVLRQAKPIRMLTEFVMVTALDETDSAVEAMRLGAYDYLVKPVDANRLVLTVEKAFEHRALLSGQAGMKSGKSLKALPESFSKVITRCPRMHELIVYAHTMARGGRSILITGETGTGKELLAQGIHLSGPFHKGPFVPVNVPSISESLFESEFFGHVKGAFTGADQPHTGFFEKAHQGTLYLDEIGELSLNMQAKLLRALEEKAIVPVGDTERRSLQLGIISSTNSDLNVACRKGRFRLDLLYRIKGAHIQLPPLRERPLDIALLARHFVKVFCREHQKDEKRLDPESIDLLLKMEYTGNVRELRHLVENGVLMSKGDVIRPWHLRESADTNVAHNRTLCTLKENDAAHVAFVLQQTEGDRKETARILGVTVRQVQRKLVQLHEHPHWGRVIGKFMPTDTDNHGRARTSNG